MDACAPVPGLVGRYFAGVGPKYAKGAEPAKAGKPHLACAQKVEADPLPLRPSCHVVKEIGRGDPFGKPVAAQPVRGEDQRLSVRQDLVSLGEKPGNVAARMSPGDDLAIGGGKVEGAFATPPRRRDHQRCGCLTVDCRNGEPADQSPGDRR